ncbi:MAG: phosphonate ABC transporter, permease protein PhnE [Rhodobacterales bacterium]|nr:phosphonate ABC transporter, permease protein PhnE [Rhodobacterales bacterium]
MTAQTPDIARYRTACPRAFRAPPEVRLRRAVIWTGFVLLVAWCLYDFGFSPERIWNGLGRLGRVLGFMFPPRIWTDPAEIADIARGLGETLSMAFLGTLPGAVVAFPLSFLGAKNINCIPFLRFGVRRGFDVIRALETLILALVFIRASGLGPLPGVLAIAVGEVGVLARLYAEAIGNTSNRPVEGVVSAGGSRAQANGIGLMPQVWPVLLSVTLSNFESNVRSGTILGMVGAGGIGFLLSDRIGAYRWDEAWSIIFLIIAMVHVIDALSARIRSRFIGKWEGAR